MPSQLTSKEMLIQVERLALYLKEFSGKLSQAHEKSTKEVKVVRVCLYAEEVERIIAVLARLSNDVQNSRLRMNGHSRR